MKVKELIKALYAFDDEAEILVATNYFSELTERDFSADTVYYEASKFDDLSDLDKNSCSIKKFLYNQYTKVLYIELDMDSLPPAGY